VEAELHDLAVGGVVWRTCLALSFCLLGLSLVIFLGAAEPRADEVRAPSYLEDVQPILTKRCVACHGCLGSPCNLKLTSFRGLDRGAYGPNPYAIHFEDYERTNMDAAPTTEAWRERGFYLVVSREGSPEQRRLDSLFSHILEAGERENRPGFSRQAQMPLYGERFNHSCPATPAALDGYLRQNPGAGMPFGLPALEAGESETLQNWIGAGAPGPAEADLKAAKAPVNPAAVAAWETFFNGPGEKERLVARYIFEHVFLARIALAESLGDVFRLVRSATPPGEPVEIIDTALPYDDPLSHAGVARFHYRLDKVTEPIVQKNHFVWHLAEKDIGHLKNLFFSEPWSGAASLTPPWGVGNPF
jgi:hypothetical protein